MADEGGGGVLRQLLAVFGFSVDVKELKKGENELEGFFDSIKKLAAGIAGVFVAHEIVEFAESGVHAMSEIEHASQRLGISTDRVQEFQFAAKELGLDADALTRSMGRLQVSQQAAAKGSQQSASAFSAMGVDVHAAGGKFKSADELMLDVADGIAKQTDASKQAAMATQLFGRSGRELLPFLKEGRKGVEELAEDFKALGGGYTEAAIEKSKAFEKQSARLGLAFTGLKSTILGALLPVITRIVSGITAAVGWLRKLSENSNAVRASMLTLGAVASVFAIQMAVAFAPLLLMAAAIGAVVLAVDEIITTFQGGDSLIRDGIDAVFGKGATTDTVKAIRDYWGDIHQFLRDIKDLGREIYDEWQKLDAIFTSFSAGATGNPLMIAQASQKFDKTFRETGPAIARNWSDTHGGAFGVPPSLSPAGIPTALLPNGGGVVIENINVPPHLATKEAAEHIGQVVDARLKQHNRDIASTTQRGTAVQGGGG